MHCSRLILAVCLLALLSSMEGSAQSNSGIDGADVRAFTPRIWIGLTGARSENVHTSGVQRLPGECDCGFFGDGKGAGSQFGAAARYEITEMFALDARTVSDFRPASYSDELPGVLVLSPDDQVLSQTNSVYSDVDYRLVTTDVMATVRLPILLGIGVSASAGPSLGVVQKATYTHWQQMHEPKNARYINPENYPTEDNGRRLIFARGAELPSAAGVRFSAKAGGGVEAKLLDLVTVRLGAYYDFGLTDVVSDRDWKINSTLYQAEILIGL